MSSLEADIEQLKQKQATATVEAAAIRSKIPAETGGSTLAALTDRRRELTETVNALSASKGGTRTKLDAIAEAEEQAGEYRKDITAIARALNDYQTLVQAFGLDGIQYMIIRGVVPEIMHRANLSLIHI